MQRVSNERLSYLKRQAEHPIYEGTGMIEIADVIADLKDG